MNPSQFRTPSNLKRTETSHSHRRSPQEIVQQIKTASYKILESQGNIHGPNALFQPAYSTKSAEKKALKKMIHMRSHRKRPRGLLRGDVG